MSSNSFGNLFKITTWGESHGTAIGVVIDGCPSNLEISEDFINKELKKRSPGKKFTSKRREDDKCQILSGVFNGKTTGAPISIIIKNCHVDSKRYEKTKDLLKPSHANFTYFEKYGIFNHLGSSRASGRETALWVAASAIAKKYLHEKKIKVVSFLKSIGNISIRKKEFEILDLEKKLITSKIFCPCRSTEEKMIVKLNQIIDEKDSIGGIIETVAKVPKSLGDPVFEKIDANLAKACISIPGCKGIEFGDGFLLSKMQGSFANDLYDLDKNNNIITKTNHSGGILGGITNSMPLNFKCAIKPTPTIGKDQKTITFNKEEKILKTEKSYLHDPCVAIRAVPVVEAMTYLVLMDTYLLNLLSKK